MSKREAAHKLAKAGFRVFPLVNNGKIPAISGDWQVVATKDPAKIDRLWSDPVFESDIDFNIGIALDPDTLVVDVDVRDGKKGEQSLKLLEALYEPLPDTYTVVTASGGQHRYFKADDSGAFPAQLAEHIDLKGAGGYVVGPGSEIDNRSYVALAGIRTNARLPDFVGTFVSERPRSAKPGRQSTPLVDLDSPEATQRAIEYLTTAPDAGTFARAAKVKDFGISQEACLDLMLEHWPGADTRDTDHIEFRVGNAYRYGQNAPGIANPEAEFDAVEPAPGIPGAKRKGLYYVKWDDAKPNLDQPYLIDDVMDLGAMVVTYGDSNAGKTYVVLDQAFSIAAGKDWNGHKVKQGLVVYIAAEGGTGFQKRIEAYRLEHKAHGIPFALIPCPIDLQSDTADTNKLIKLIREIEADFGQKCVLTVVDTLARAMGGGDENTSVDMSKFVGHCDRLRTALGCTTNVIHHTGKDKAKGARGSSALRAATDTEIEVQPGVFEVKKQRDLETVEQSRFRLKSVAVGSRVDGKAVTACVVEWIVESEFEVKVTPDAEAFLKMFEALIDAEQERIVEAGGEPDDATVAWSGWKLSGLSEFSANKAKPVSESYLFKLRKELLTSGLVAQNKQKQWVTGNTYLTHL